MTEHDYKAEVLKRGDGYATVTYLPIAGTQRGSVAFSPLMRGGDAEAAAQHFADKLNTPDLTAEVERLTAERDEMERRWRSCDLYRQTFPDPEAPPIPCVEVDATDGRRTWRAMGEDVRTLGDEWERKWRLGSGDPWRVAEFGGLSGYVYLIRRTTPPSPKTERVPLHRLNGRVLKGYRRQITNVSQLRGDKWRLSMGGPYVDVTTYPDGTVEVLTEDGD